MKRWKALRSLVVTGRRPSSTRDAERLVEKHYATVYNLAYRTLGQRQDAEDIAQQTFLRAMPRLDELDGQDPAGWLCRVAANLCIDELRRSKRRHSGGQLADEMWDELASPGPFGSPEATLEQRELRLAVWRAALALPPQQRLALALREWHGMSYAQIAGALATSVSAVETLLFRARQGFRRAYEQRLAQPPADDAGCAWCLERLSASVDGELSVAERRRVDDHIERCPTCRFAAAELRTTSRLYALLPLFVPALPAKAALLTAISGIGAVGGGAALKVAGAGAAGAAAANASGGLTDVVGSSATVAGAAGLAGASVAASGAAGAGAAGVVGAAGVSSVAGSSVVAGAASALGAAKAGAAAVAVAAAISTAVWSSSQPEVPAPVADAPAAVVMTTARPAQVANDLAQAAEPDLSHRQRQAEDSPVAPHDENQQEESAQRPGSQAQQNGSVQPRGQTDRPAGDEDSPQASKQADRVAEAEDRPRTHHSELEQVSGRQATEASDDLSKQAGASESTQVGHDQSAQIGSRASTQAEADQPEPGGADDESPTRLVAGRLAQSVATSEAGEDGPDRLDDDEARPGGDAPRHPESDTPDSGD